MLTLAIAFALSAPLSGGIDQDLTADIEDVERAAEVQAAARDFLEMVDRQDWQGSFAATSSGFQSANTVQGWADASELVYGELGALEERGEATARFVNAPPNGFQEVRFASRFAGRGAVTEILTLAKEDGVWKVVGIMID